MSRRNLGVNFSGSPLTNRDRWPCVSRPIRALHHDGLAPVAAGHAERLIALELESMGVAPSQVSRIYSELQPCSVPGGYCGNFIAQKFPQATVTYSFPYGETKASRAEGIGALKAAVPPRQQESSAATPEKEAS